MSAYPFPSEFVSPKDKEKAQYGAAYARAIYHSDSPLGMRRFDYYDEHDAFTELAQGRESVSRLTRTLGKYRTDRPEFSDGPDSLVFIDAQVLPLAPKYINRMVAKMQANRYDIGLDAIDLLSVNTKEEIGNTIRAFYRWKEWSTTMGVPLQAAFEGIDVASLPKYPDELLYDLTTNPKLKKEIEGENALKLIMGMNNFNQKMRQVDWDLCVYGHGHIHLYHDANMVPRADRINGKYWGGSYVDNDDFEQQENSYFFEAITTNQFIREASPYYNQAELQSLINAHGIKNSSFSSKANVTSTPMDGLSYMPVMRFYFLSEDSRTFVKRKNQYGSKAYFEKDFNYDPFSKETQDKALQANTPIPLERYMEGGDSKIYRNTYTSVYGGTWIVDSDCVYQYGLKRYPRTNLVEATLPIKTFATNYKDGRFVSALAQAIEPIFMVNVVWNKIKSVLAREWIGSREIDFNQLENVALGRGGQAWKPRDVFEFLEMSHTLPKRSIAKAGLGSVGNAVTYHSTGVTLADYLNTFTLAMNQLEALTATTVAESAQQPDRLAVGVMKQAQITGDLDMEYLYNGHEYMYTRTAHHLMLMTQEAKRSKVALKGFLPALGGMFEISDEVAYCEYGMLITRQASPEEWASFYDDMRKALEVGRISPADSAFVREIDNLKQARLVLVNRESMYQRQLAQQKQMDIEANQKSNSMSIQEKLRADMATIDYEYKKKAELMQVQGMIDQILQRQKSEQEALVKGMEVDMKKTISTQQGVDGIMKQAMKNMIDKQKIERMRVGQNAA